MSDNSCKLVEEMKSDIIDDWLISLSSEKSGFKGFYSIRKKVITGELARGLEQKDYWFNIGRLAELKQMCFLSLDLIKKYESTDKNRKKDKK